MDLVAWSSTHPGMFVAGVVYTPSQYVILALSNTPEEALRQANLRLTMAGVELPISKTHLEEALRPGDSPSGV